MKLAFPLLFRNRDVAESAPVAERERSTSPEARMNLLLRFETSSGPRTIIVSGVPLRNASEITAAMIKSGQYAEFIDQCTPMTVKERVKNRRMEKLRKRVPDAAIHSLNDIVALSKKGRNGHAAPAQSLTDVAAADRYARQG